MTEEGKKGENGEDNDPGKTHSGTTSRTTSS